MKTPRSLPYILAASLLLFLIAMVQTQKPLNVKISKASFLGDYFHLPPQSDKAMSGITKDQYSQLLGKFHLHFFNKVFNETKLPFLVQQEWESPYFAAFAKQSETVTEVSLWGGMARAPGATPTILAAVLCHELGHIIGGKPLQTIPGAEWSSTEGQSDFYAARACLPDFLKSNPHYRPAYIEQQVLDLCDDNTVCQDSAQAGLDLVRFMQKYSYRSYATISVHTPAETSSGLVRNSYPSDQCRLDSFVQGALCLKTGGDCRPPSCWTGIPN